MQCQVTWTSENDAHSLLLPVHSIPLHTRRHDLRCLTVPSQVSDDVCTLGLCGPQAVGFGLDVGEIYDAPSVGILAQAANANSRRLAPGMAWHGRRRQQREQDASSNYHMADDHDTRRQRC